ncbi:hypothetical protein RFI_15642 [Reticulomyxa filosa]|uniref:Uncharacterized protein n=1 Tax=Reticulomyxa filosa TaxID=46433 RepID=X6N5K3_RETFI|nr:hypothetical protein RFI_15642 [Reticulomyxa filosa]|eukprot:ETO21560.1 hypothetical protein RFI_15642 [Reticulomyxa filosa]
MFFFYEYNELTSITDYLKDCLLKVSKTTLTLLSAKEKFILIQKKKKRPDIVEDYFELIVCYMKRTPLLVLQHVWLLEKIFVKGLDGMQMQHRRAFDSLCQFYKYAVALGRPVSRRNKEREKDKKRDEGELGESDSNTGSTDSRDSERDPRIIKLLHDHGRTLVFHIMKGLMYEVMLPSLSSLEQVLEEIYQLNKSTLKEQMKYCLEQLCNIFYLLHINICNFFTWPLMFVWMLCMHW